MKGATFNQLMMFHTIVKEGSITKAAQKLEIASPSVSNALKALESQVGLPLFIRTTRRIELTEAGRQLFEQTKTSVDDLQSAFESVSELGKAPSGKVRLTTPRFVFDYLLQPIYGEFCARYPDIDLEISISDAAIDILKEGYDLGIRFGDRVQEGMVAKALTEPMKEALFVSPKYIEQYGLPQSPSDLSSHKLIQYRFITSNQIAPLLLDESGVTKAYDVPNALIVNDTNLMVDAALQGLGIGRIVEPVIKPYFEKQTLVPVLEAYWCPYSALYLYFHKNTQKAKRIRVFIDFLIEKLREQ
ncbi:LysR family transcriptional regulator [Pseudoalteromonas phenolica]|uniref:LysR family transcriptional regulator n=1 Tax=Pseudoalteromonas phenolica TaxID=161398 RepID=UPI00110BA54B|nr:LysR family transcriptional regulator [Pseudoalteromonas phenolica]TMO58280.1 LysR family transcriptional regulator [Pseudoalteromonas phenolica]